MVLIDKKELDIIFTIAMPIDKAEIVNMVTSLQGIVDNKTLISQLWFVKDVDEVLENLKIQKKEAQQEYLDSFGLTKSTEQYGEESNNKSQEEKADE